MQDTREDGWDSDAADVTETEVGTDRQSALHSGDVGETDGWQQYRKWISKSPAPRARRSGVDPSLYTWKGYRNWTEQVKRNWNES